jgi:diketogulonate reductase-like aldo/keto reductase
VNQVEANVWCQRRPEAPWHGKYGVVMQAYAPMGRCRPPEFFEDPVLNAVAAAHGKSVRQVMLRYLMQIGIAVIPKSVHPERIAENFQILDFSLNDAEMASIAELDLNEPVIGKPQDPERTSKLTSL